MYFIMLGKCEQPSERLTVKPSEGPDPLTLLQHGSSEEVHAALSAAL